MLTITLYSTMVTKYIACFKHSTTNAVHKDQPVNVVRE